MSDPVRRFGGRYELLGLLSAGPGGAVWCGRDLLAGAGCAVRVLEPGLAADPAGGGDLLGVLGRVGRLAHPNIVAVEDIVSGEGCSALVMPLVSGESLQARLARLGVLPQDEAGALVAQLCDALAAAHAAGLAHGRVKPSNILLEPGADARLTVKLTDFGMAALGAGVSAGPRSAGAAVSAAVYRAPELEFAMPPTPQADVYAAGVVLYEALAGRPPFTGTRALDIAQQHRQADPPPVPEASGALRSLVAACLAKDPGRRPTAGELAGLLRQAAPSTPQPRPVLPRVTVKVPAAAHLPLFDAALFDQGSAGAEPFDAGARGLALAPTDPIVPGRAPEPTVVIAPRGSHHRPGARGRRTELAVTIGVALLVGAVAFAIGGRRPGAPEAGSRVLPARGGAAAAGTGLATGTANGAGDTPGGAAGPPGSSPTSAPSSPAAAAGSPSPDATADTTGIPVAAGSQGTTAAAVTAGPPAGGLGVADPIGYLEGLRTQIQALVAQGPATIDPVAAGDLQNLVLDLENSVVSYQQNGGAAHVQEIRQKVAGFDERLSLLVGQGRLSQAAADQLAAYLGRLAPA